MIAAIILLSLISVIFLAVGFLIWKRERISLLHDYHRNHVSPENKKAFCALSGIGVIMIGLGILLTAVILAFTDSAWSFIAFAAGFLSGIFFLMHAVKKYNQKQL